MQNLPQELSGRGSINVSFLLLWYLPSGLVIYILLKISFLIQVSMHSDRHDVIWWKMFCFSFHVPIRAIGKASPSFIWVFFKSLKVITSSSEIFICYFLFDFVLTVFVCGVVVKWLSLLHTSFNKPWNQVLRRSKSRSVSEICDSDSFWQWSSWK